MTSRESAPRVSGARIRLEWQDPTANAGHAEAHHAFQGPLRTAHAPRQAPLSPLRKARILPQRSANLASAPCLVGR